MTPRHHRLARATRRFFFAPASARPLEALRIGLAAVLLVQALQLVPVFFDLYHHDGVLRGALMDAFTPIHQPALGEFVAALTGGGTAERLFLTGCGALYLASLLAMLLGWRARVATGSAWLLHLFFMMLAPHTNYGADDFANVFLFYAMWTPGRAADPPREENRLLLRVMQLHLCIAYLFTGVEKASGSQWRDGDAIWRSLMTQNYALFDFSWLAQVPALAVIAGWLVLAIEIGYPVFIWPRRTRRPWIVAVVAMHVGIGLFLGLHVFSLVMIVLTVSLFGVSPEPE